MSGLTGVKPRGLLWRLANTLRPPLPRMEGIVAAILVAYFGFIFLLPVGQTLWYSLTNYDVLTGEGTFIGFRNYIRMLQDPLFWNGLRVALAYTVVVIIVGLSLEIPLAACFTVFRGLARTVLMLGYFLSAVIPNMAVVMIWRNMYRVDYGLLDVVARGIGVRPLPWLTDPTLAIVSIIIVTVWKWMGYGAVIFLAGLNEIPESLYEAARLDGASALRQFFNISLPLLRPVILVQVVASVITLFQFFDPFYGLTTGGPGDATRTLILYIYEEGFQRLNFGYAAAMTTGMFILLLSASALQLWVGRRHLL